MNAIHRKRIRAVVTFMVVGAIGGFLVALVVSQIDRNPLLGISLRGATIGVLVGFGVGVGEELLLRVWSRRVGFFALNVLRVTVHGAVLFLSLVAVNGAVLGTESGEGFLAGAREYVTEDRPARDFVMAVVVLALVASLLEIRTLHNRGDLWRFLTGRYRYPQEEARVFLFADVVGSTGLAERLGNLEYSALLREVFSDTSEAILAWRGHVYQFAGDGVIVTWRSERGLSDAACVRCFFEMGAALEARRDAYEERFGTTPRLRGGLHGGDVVTTWVGEAKKELAFHGDVLNATARIESMAKERGAHCLVSEWVIDRVSLPAGLRAGGIGEVRLRGKERPLVLYAVDRLPGTADRATAADADSDSGPAHRDL